MPGEIAPSYLHTDVWEWTVDASIESLKDAIRTFHQLPRGLCKVSLISDQGLYRDLIFKLDEVAALAGTDPVEAGNKLIEFEIMVGAACDSLCPSNASSSYVGIINTLEYPVCCKLIADAEYIGNKLGIFRAVK